MARPEFMPFTAVFNPFRILERRIDRMFDEDFVAGAAGCIVELRQSRLAEPAESRVKTEG